MYGFPSISFYTQTSRNQPSDCMYNIDTPTQNHQGEQEPRAVHVQEVPAHHAAHGASAHTRGQDHAHRKWRRGRARRGRQGARHAAAARPG